jgi:iodotyrosine deiodinase
VPRFVPYRPPRPSEEETLARLDRDLEVANRRRTVRMFSTEPVPRRAIELALRIAGTAPSGAHRQPWHFVAISNSALKRRIREAAEKEEREFYERKAPPEWLEALAPLGTDFVKSHLTDAPWLIVVFRRDYEDLPDGRRLKSYYMTESVGIAVGFLIQALHRSGLASLTHTPAPRNFLREICGRPASEKPFLILAVGLPAGDCVVPDLGRKSLEEIAEFVEEST